MKLNPFTGKLDYAGPSKGSGAGNVPYFPNTPIVADHLYGGAGGGEIYPVDVGDGLTLDNNILSTSTSASPNTTITPQVFPSFWFDAHHIASSDQPAVGSYVSLWQDLASQIATFPTQATQANQPTFQICDINRRPCVRFDGSDWLAKTNQSISAPTGHTIIVVQRTPAPLNYNFQFFLSGGDSSWFGWQAGRIPTRSDASGSTTNVGFSAPVYDKVSVMAYRVNASARQFWVGQTRIYSAAPTALPSTLQFSHLGSFNNTGYNFAGDLFEVIGFNVPLTDPQLSALVAQLETKWGCEHEIQGIDGNSLFSGASGGSGIQAHLRSALGRKWWVPNVAVSGQTTAQRRSAFATSMAPYMGPRLDGRKNLLLFTEFRNHLGSVSYATAWAEFQAYITDATTAGAHVIATTMLPASSGMPTGNWTEANRLAGNADIRATWSGNRLFDWEALYSSSWLSGGDGIHLTAGIGEPAVVAAFAGWMKTNGLYR